MNWNSRVERKNKTLFIFSRVEEQAIKKLVARRDISTLGIIVRLICFRGRRVGLILEVSPVTASNTNISNKLREVKKKIVVSNKINLQL